MAAYGFRKRIGTFVNEQAFSNRRGGLLLEGAVLQVARK
jgi:hypothetical protein